MRKKEKPRQCGHRLYESDRKTLRKHAKRNKVSEAEMLRMMIAFYEAQGKKEPPHKGRG